MVLSRYFHHQFAIIIQYQPNIHRDFILVGLCLSQVALQNGAEAVVLAEMMPRHWSEFVRSAPMEQVRPLGTR
jgi:hypothetical protein